MVKDKTVQDAIIDESGNRVYFTLRPEGTDMDVVPSSPECRDMAYLRFRCSCGLP